MALRRQAPRPPDARRSGASSGFRHKACPSAPRFDKRSLAHATIGTAGPICLSLSTHAGSHMSNASGRSAGNNPFGAPSSGSRMMHDGNRIRDGMGMTEAKAIPHHAPAVGDSHTRPLKDDEQRHTGSLLPLPRISRRQYRRKQNDAPIEIRT